MCEYEYRNINKALIKKLKNLFNEFNVTCIKERWKSKYNKYVEYSHAPFDTDEFTVSIVAEGNDFSTLKFIEYLFNKIEKLENSLKLEVNKEDLLECEV